MLCLKTKIQQTGTAKIFDLSIITSSCVLEIEKKKSALFPKFFSCLASQIIHIRQQANITLIHGGRKVHIDDLQRKHNFKIIRYFFNTSKCATNYVISLEGYDGFIGQKYLMLWRQESWPFAPGWAAHITSIGS